MFIPKLVISALLVGGVTLTGLPARRGVETADTKVRELQKERLVLLRQVAMTVDKQYKAGGTTLTEVLAAHRDVTVAELELCETAQERTALLRKQVDTAKEIERTADAAAKAGAVPTTHLLKAKAHRLSAEIELEKAIAAK